MNSQGLRPYLQPIRLSSSQMLMSLPSRLRTVENARGPSRLPIPAPRLLVSVTGQHHRMFRPTVPCCAGRVDRTRHMQASSTRGRSTKQSRGGLNHKEGTRSPQRASLGSPQRRRASATLPSQSSAHSPQLHPGKHQSDPRIRLS